MLAISGPYHVSKSCLSQWGGIIEATKKNPQKPPKITQKNLEKSPTMQKILNLSYAFWVGVVEDRSVLMGFLSVPMDPKGHVG